MKYETTLREAELLSGAPAGAAEHLAKIDAQAAQADQDGDLFVTMPPPGVDAGDAPESQVNRLKMLFGNAIEIHRVQ